MGIAPLVAAKRRPLHWRFLPAPAPFPAGSLYAGDANAGNIGVGAEIYVGGQGWVDISPDVYYRDGSTKVAISRGRSDENASTLPPPQTCAFQLNNRANKYSPRNPTGPLYGLIGRNTPIRFWRMQNGIRRYRYAGEVPEWPSTADISGNDVYTSMAAAGMLRRLTQGNPPVESALYRAYTKGYFQQVSGSLGTFDVGENVPNVVAYWPCEDGTQSTQIASAASGGSPMTVTGSPSYASDGSFAASSPIPVLNGSKWAGSVPSGISWTDNALRFLVHVPSGGDTDGAVVMRLYTTGTIARVDLVYHTASGGEMTLIGYNSSGTSVFSLGPFLGPLPSSTGWNGLLVRGSMALRSSGANVEYEFQGLTVGQGSSASVNGTLSSASLGAVSRVAVNPNGSLTGTSIGHVSVQNVWDTLDDLAFTLLAWYGEETDRLVRLCLEEGVNQYTVYGTATPGLGNGDGRGFDYPTGMGDQAPDTFLNLLKACVDVDASLLFEARDQVSQAWRARVSLYNQGTTYGLSPFQLTLNYARNQLSEQLTPRDDDTYTRNDVTAQQTDGTSARQYLDDGTAMSISPPPVGSGPYATTYPLNVAGDGSFPGQMSIADHAGWRLHLGTVNEPRFARVSVNLRHPTFQNSLDMMNAALSVDVGDVIEIDNPPAWLSPDPIRLIILGYQETMGAFEHEIVFNCAPESPYRVFVADDWVLGRADTDGSVLAAPLTATATSALFAATNANDPLWTTSPGDFPFDVGIGGERITVTGPGTNYSNDPYLTQGLAHYSGQNGAISLDATRPFPTNADGALNPYAPSTITIVPAGGLATDVLSDNAAFVDTPFNTSYTAWGWVYSPSGRSFKVFINWADSGGVYISTSFGNVTATAAGVWLLLTVVANRPGGAANISLGIADSGTPTSAQTFNTWGMNAAHSTDLTQSSPQTFTVVRSRNGVSKAQVAGTDVRLWQPPILSI